jgi:hypothetical protein
MPHTPCQHTYCDGNGPAVEPSTNPVLASFSSLRYRSRMPKDAFTLSDVREPTLTVVCLPCGRRGRYNVERLMEKHGDAKLLYLLDTLTNCPKMQSANIYDRCKAVYEGPSIR